MHREAARLARKLGLEKHPEGGYFKQTYRSDIMVNVEGFGSPRSAATAIYYLLAGSEFSAFHRLKSDELWHHYAGGALVLYAINDELSKIKIDKSMPQAVIRAGTWFAAAPYSKKSYCLAGCTMSPGFDYRDWELGKRDELIRAYPQHKKVVERYTK